MTNTKRETLSALVVLFCALVTGTADTIAAASAPAVRFSAEDAHAYLEAEGRLADADTLIHSAMMQDEQLVAATLAAGVDADARGILPQSALQLVASTQCQEPPHGRDVQMRIIGMLLDAGADVHDKAFGDTEIIVWAAQQCPPIVVARLLDAGANIEARSPQGFSPLSMALIVKNHDTAELLIERGARLKPETVTKLFSDLGDDTRIKDLVAKASAPR